MARKREKKGSLLHQAKIELDSKLAIGQSKFWDKQIGDTLSRSSRYSEIQKSRRTC